jgi:phage baseplate assembly protein W
MLRRSKSSVWAQLRTFEPRIRLGPLRSTHFRTLSEFEAIIAWSKVCSQHPHDGVDKYGELRTGPDEWGGS